MRDRPFGGSEFTDPQLTDLDEKCRTPANSISNDRVTAASGPSPGRFAARSRSRPGRVGNRYQTTNDDHCGRRRSRVRADIPAPTFGIRRRRR